MKGVVFMNKPGESIQHRSGVCESYMDETHTQREKACDAKLEVTAGFT